MTTPGKDTDTTPRENLLDVAESLFIAEGVSEVSLRSIARAAGQKNPSALHYHFGSRKGLMEAIAARRLQQQEARRADLLRAAMQSADTLSLWEVNAIMLRGSYLLCREDATFRNILGVFGLQWFALASDYFSVEFSQDSPALIELWELGAQSLDHLPADLLALRMENAYGAGLLALSRRARAKDSFRGSRAELFFNNLVDQLTAMLEAPVSDHTEALLG